MRKIILSIIGILLIVMSFFLAKSLIASKNKPKPVLEKVIKTVFVDTVKNGQIQIQLPANGSLVAKRRVEIYSEVQGIFKTGNVLFKPGQRFSAGQTLIRIDASEYYASVQSSKSNLYNAIAAIMPDLRLDFPEVYQKWQDYLNSFDLSKSTPKLPEMSSEKENYFITGRGIVSNYYNLKNLEQRLTKYIITAPFSGVLTEALVTEGTLIRNGQKLGEFIDTSEYEMEVAISKSYANLLKVGEEVALNNLDNTGHYVGTISRVNGSVDQATQTITAYIDVKDPNLKEGIYLEAHIKGETVEDAIEIDRNLVLESQEIFIVTNETLDALPVKPIYFSETKVVIKGV
ncbi:MAG: HlyD family efflux transporter periplasmic adaptor subunit, partial [Flavobacteriales bacterium]|nr:HlyD family efflux transporter periplasmic adaptor subunit [Flavobacteriales bacterium]